MRLKKKNTLPKVSSGGNVQLGYGVGSSLGFPGYPEMPVCQCCVCVKDRGCGLCGTGIVCFSRICPVILKEKRCIVYLRPEF